MLSKAIHLMGVCVRHNEKEAQLSITRRYKLKFKSASEIISSNIKAHILLLMLQQPQSFNIEMGTFKYGSKGVELGIYTKFPGICTQMNLYKAFVHK